MYISALEAKYEAQKIAFAPIVFQAVRTAKSLKILDLIDNSKSGITDEEIASQLNIGIYGVEVLLDLIRFMKVVEIDEDGKNKLSKIGYFLLHDDLTVVNMDFVHDVCYEGLFFLEDAIKTGKPSGLKVFGEWDTIYEGLSKLPQHVQDSWFGFDHFYSDGSFSTALEFVFKQPIKTLYDVGGNTGKWAKNCVEFHPSVNIVIHDLPGQLNKAKQTLAEHEHGNRVEFREVDLLNDDYVFQGSPDAIWMSQFLDCFSKEEIISILKRAAKVMTKESSLYIMETYWDRQAFDVAEFSLHCTSLYFTAMANGNSRMYHSKDMMKCLSAAGMYIDDEVDNIGVSHTIFRCKLK